MQIYLKNITGYEDAFAALRMSKRSWTPEWDDMMRDKVQRATNRIGQLLIPDTTSERIVECNEFFKEQMRLIIKYGVEHITLLRFIDFSFIVDGLHRAGQDDLDAHAARFGNRIVRASTRLGHFNGKEVSEWYQDKILPIDVALKYIEGVSLPEKITANDQVFVRGDNGYIREDLKDDKDAKRGLYMECIPSMFTFKVNLTEWVHVYKLRNKDTMANPEVRNACETMADLLESTNPFLTRGLFFKINN